MNQKNVNKFITLLLFIKKITSAETNCFQKNKSSGMGFSGSRQLITICNE